MAVLYHAVLHHVRDVLFGALHHIRDEHVGKFRPASKLPLNDDPRSVPSPAGGAAIGIDIRVLHMIPPLPALSLLYFGHLLHATDGHTVHAIHKYK